MAVSKDISLKGYCDKVDSELTEMKSRLLDIIKEIETRPVDERKRLLSHIPHLNDLVDTIDWKLGILTKVCPIDWSGFSRVEVSVPSVELREGKLEPEPTAGGYMGG